MEPVELRLPRGAPLGVRVLDGAAGTPVEGARVFLVGQERRGPVLLERTCDGGGRADLGVVAAPGETEPALALHVEHAAHAALSHGITAADLERGELELRLSPGVALEGRVLVDGRPPAEPLVIALNPAARGWRFAPQIARHARTDAEGRFRLTALAPGEYRYDLARPFLDQELLPLLLTGEIASYYDADKGIFEDRVARGEVEVGPEPVTRFDVELRAEDFPPTGRVGGRVSVHGSPAAGVIVNLRSEERWHAARTDASGAFDFGPVAAGETRLLVRDLEAGRGDRYDVVQVTERFELEVGEERWVELELTPFQVPFRVRAAADGLPVEDARIFLEPASPDSMRGLHGAGASARTDAEGRALLRSQRHGEFTWRVELAGYVTAMGLLAVPASPAPAGPVELALERAAPCAGRLVFEGFESLGDELPNGRLSVRDAAGAELTGSYIRGGRESFRFDTLAPGSYTVDFTFSGGHTEPAALEVPPSGVKEALLVLRLAGD